MSSLEDRIAELLGKSAAHKKKALSALRMNSSASVRQKRYEQQMARSKVLDIQARELMKKRPSKNISAVNIDKGIENGA